MKHFNLLLALFLNVLVSNAYADTTISITHPAIPAPTLLDLGKAGQSVGDIRIWHFPAKTSDGVGLMTDWIMTTTGIIEGKGTEYRITNAVFSFGDGTKDQISIQGVAEYSSVSATLNELTVTRRSITGGTGKFANAIGWIETTHLKDNSWVHTIYLK